jgi:dTDP-4-dehydrorhamnose reductase
MSPTDLARFGRLPLLITGIAGVAGYNAWRHFRTRYPGRVVGIRPRKNVRFIGDGVVALDAEDRPGMRELFRQHRFAAVLNAVGNCALKSCELDPAMARLVNVASAEAVVENVRAFGSRLVHLSSDLVFSGAGTGNYVETDPVDPVTVYGKTMVEAEQIFAASVPEAAMLRISLPMGPSFNGHAGAIDWIQHRFRHGWPATLYFDEIRSCTYCDDLNRVFERFVGGDENGLYHLGGPRGMTLYQIAQIVSRVGGFDPALLKGCPRIEAGPVPPRAGNVTMCSQKLIGLLGEQPFRPWPVGVYPADRQWHRERPPGEEGSRRAIEAMLYRYLPLAT